MAQAVGRLGHATELDALGGEPSDAVDPGKQASEAAARFTELGVEPAGWTVLRQAVGLAPTPAASPLA